MADSKMSTVEYTPPEEAVFTFSPMPRNLKTYYPDYSLLPKSNTGCRPIESYMTPKPPDDRAIHQLKMHQAYAGATCFASTYEAKRCRSVPKDEKEAWLDLNMNLPYCEWKIPIRPLTHGQKEKVKGWTAKALMSLARKRTMQDDMMSYSQWEEALKTKRAKSDDYAEAQEARPLFELRDLLEDVDWSRPVEPDLSCYEVLEEPTRLEDLILAPPSQFKDDYECLTIEDTDDDEGISEDETDKAVDDRLKEREVELTELVDKSRRLLTSSMLALGMCEKQPKRNERRIAKLKYDVLDRQSVYGKFVYELTTLQELNARRLERHDH